jgi:SIR2-like domain/Effector-associated domain 1
MAIQPKLKHQIVRLLAGLVSSKTDAVPYCDAAELDTSVITFENAAYTNWFNIITAAEKQELLDALLAQLAAPFSGNSELKRLIAEVKEGFDRRVEQIAKAIKMNQCVLFLGPDLLQCMESGQIKPFNRLFSEQLAKELEMESVYYDRDQASLLPYIAQRFEDMPTYVIGEVGAKAKVSFEHATVYRQVYDVISSFAYPLIINTNPDSILDDIYRQKLINGQPVNVADSYYDMTNDIDGGGSFTADLSKPNTVVSYKIFGSFENPASILFTDAHRVLFSKNVVKNDPPLPPLIKKLLANKYYIFLGFNFSEWHLKILIDCLGLAKNEHRSFALTNIPGMAGSSMNEYFEKEYKFYFIENDIEKFIGQVKEEYDQLP